MELTDGRFVSSERLKSTLSAPLNRGERRIAVVMDRSHETDQRMSSREPGDCSVAGEICQPGRSRGQIVASPDALRKQCVSFLAIYRSIPTGGRHGVRTGVPTTLFGPLAPVERNLISKSAREGLAGATFPGNKLEWPEGLLGVACLEGE